MDGTPQAESTVVFPSYATFPVPRNCPGTLKGNTWSIRIKSSSRIWRVKIPGDSLKTRRGQGKGTLFSLPWGVLPAHQILRLVIEKNTTSNNRSNSWHLSCARQCAKCFCDNSDYPFNNPMKSYYCAHSKDDELRLAKRLAKVPELEITLRWYLNAALARTTTT